MAASNSPSTVQQSQLACLFFDFAPPPASFKCKIVVQIIAYYRTTKQFFLLELIDHVFLKALVPFDFDEKYTQRVAEITM